MRTIIEIPINYHTDEAHARLRGYFGAKGYAALQVGPETVMCGGDKMLGMWYIVPQVFEGRVVLQGFVGRPGKKEQNLDGFVGALIKAPARTALDELAGVLYEQSPASNPYQGNQQPVQENPYPYQGNQYPPQDSSYPYQNSLPQSPQSPEYGNQTQASYIPAQTPGALSEKNAKYAIWSVVMGVISCLLTFFGGIASFLFLAIGIGFGFAARKTSKRILAIVGIVLNFVAIALFIVLLIWNYWIY